MKSAAGLRVLCLGSVLFLAAAFGADQHPSPIGLTQNQVIEQYGEPKSQIAAAGRVVLFFARERMVLRNGVVVEVEMLPADPPPRRLPAPPPIPAEAPAPVPAPANVAPAPVPLPGAPAANVAEPVPSSPPGGAPAPSEPAGQAASTPPPEEQLSFRFVRPPSAGAPRPAPKRVAPPPPAPPPDIANIEAKVVPTPPVAREPSQGSPVRPAPTSAGGTGATVVPRSGDSSASAAPTEAGPIAVTATTPAPTVAAGTPTADATTTDKVDEAPPAAPVEKKAKAKVRARRLEEADFPDPTESIFTTQTYFIAFLVVSAGIGFLVWQRNQRQLELAASAVSRTPFSTPVAATGGGALFPSNLLPEMEWKRFEELVEAYYSKTGVVAVRTKAGPESAVHIKISWKGESRPFAFVQCIPHPQGLIEVKPLQELFAALTAEDIRRGYVVTTGKFNVAARDFAEEKHITLMTGDIFLEKLNALPSSARTELIQEFSVGDYTTPTCPKCDTKMTKGADDPAVWCCKTHADVRIPAWK